MESCQPIKRLNDQKKKKKKEEKEEEEEENVIMEVGKELLKPSQLDWLISENQSENKFIWSTTQ